ncbi:MAG: hypothetical protein RLZZ416_51 [Candidatus Parcubacteria bacterium]
MLVLSTLLTALPADAACAGQYPVIGTVGSVQADQYGNTKLLLNHVAAFNASGFPTTSTNIDQYNALAAAFKQNGYVLPANYAYTDQYLPQGYASWSDYIAQNYNYVYVSATALSAISYQIGDIVIQGPPGGAACTQYGFLGFFGQNGTIQSAVATDGGYQSYQYGSETLSLSAGAQESCRTTNNWPNGSTVCDVPITYSVGGASFTVHPGQSHSFPGSRFAQVTLTQSTYTTPSCQNLGGGGAGTPSCWIEDFSPVSMLHVLTFNAAPLSCAPSWSCSQWSMCYSNGVQSRTCTDQNACNSIANKPTEIQSCITQVQPCIFNNQSIPSGSSVVAYQSASAPQGGQCASETRYCSNGALSGSFQNASCTVQSSSSIDALKAQIASLLAQIAQLQKAIAALGGGSSPGQCPVIARTLSLGERGADVLTLQNYFVSISLLASDSATGFFGFLTQGAVQSWQSSHGLVSSGSPDTTGYGAVGPRTRAALAQCIIHL